MKNLTSIQLGLLFVLTLTTDAWSLPHCPDDPFKIWDMCKGIHEDGMGNKYIGEFKQGKYHGRGKLLKSDGTVREGKWANGRFNNDSNQNKARTQGSTAKIDPNSLYRVGSGTGFAVSNTGYIVTNAHVITGCDDVDIPFEGKDLSLSVVFTDARNDLALLKGKFNPDQVYKLSRDGPKLMEDVFVAGYPFGDKYSGAIKVTKGVVSSLTGYNNNLSNFQFDAAINAGNSGGPIFNFKGNVVGVTVSGLSDIKVLKQTGDLPQNANFGIQSNIVISLLNSNGIYFKPQNKKELSRSHLRRIANGATYFVRCFKTGARILKEKK